MIAHRITHAMEMYVRLRVVAIRIVCPMNDVYVECVELFAIVMHPVDKDKFVKIVCAKLDAEVIMCVRVIKHVSIINVRIHVHRLDSVEHVQNVLLSIMVFNVVVRLVSLEMLLQLVRCHCRDATHIVSVMRPVYSVPRHVTRTTNALVDKSALVVNVERNAIQELAPLDNYARMELVLPAVVRIWIVPVIDLVSTVNAWTHASVIMLAERMLSVKYPNTEQFAYAPMASKVNQSKDVHRMNVKPTMTVNTISNVTMAHAKIHAFNPVPVALTLSVALSIVMRNALVHQDTMEIQLSNVHHKLLALVLGIRAVRMPDVVK